MAGMGRGPNQGFTLEEIKRVVLTCATCGGKFAPTIYTRRMSIRHFCTRQCQLEWMKRTGGGGV